MSVPVPRNEEEQYLTDLIACTVGDVVYKKDAQTQQRLDDLVITTKELSSIAQQLLQGMALTNQSVQSLQKTVEEHDHALRGEGGMGLIAQVARVLPIIEENKKVLWGDGEKPGLISRVLTLERTTERWSKPIWLAISVILTGLIMFGLDKFLK